MPQIPWRCVGRLDLSVRGCVGNSLVCGRCGPGLLDPGAVRLGLQPASPGSRRRPGGDPWRGWFHCTLDQSQQRIQRSLPIALLGPMPLRRDQQCSLLREPLAGELTQSHLHVIRQPGGGGIEPQLHRRRDLVDVLPAGSRRTDETFADRPLVNRYGRCDPDQSIATSGQAQPPPRFLRPAARLAGLAAAFRPSPIFLARVERVWA